MNRLAVLDRKTKAWLLVAAGALCLAVGVVFNLGFLSGLGAGIGLVGAIFAFTSRGEN